MQIGTRGFPFLLSEHLDTTSVQLAFVGPGDGMIDGSAEGKEVGSNEREGETDGAEEGRRDKEGTKDGACDG